MAVLIRYAPSNLTRELYDNVNGSLGEDTPPPAPLRIHVLFGDEGSLRVSEIWESEADWREWWPRLQSALSDAGVEIGEPEILQVHELWGNGLQPS